MRPGGAGGPRGSSSWSATELEVSRVMRTLRGSSGSGHAAVVGERVQADIDARPDEDGETRLLWATGPGPGCICGAGDSGARREGAQLALVPARCERNRGAARHGAGPGRSGGPKGGRRLVTALAERPVSRRLGVLAVVRFSASSWRRHRRTAAGRARRADPAHGAVSRGAGHDRAGPLGGRRSRGLGCAWAVSSRREARFGQRSFGRRAERSGAARAESALPDDLAEWR